MDASDSPTNLLRISLGPADKKAASASPAIALASWVFPQPGGPKSKIEADNDRTPTKMESAIAVGSANGRRTSSSRSFTALCPMISLNRGSRPSPREE
jgi:hypothetical protein